MSQNRVEVETDLRRVALAVIRKSFYESELVERVYYGKLSRTYTLLLSLSYDPKVVEYFTTMTGRYQLFIGADIFIRALSERYLAKADQMTVNMLQIIRESGGRLVLTAPVIEEIHAHIRSCDNEFYSYFAHIEDYVPSEVVNQCSRILVRAYFHARSNWTNKKRPRSWRAFVEQICSHTDIRNENKSRKQIRRYLQNKFECDYLDRSYLRRLTDDDELEDLTERIAGIKKDRRLAHNDALHILAVYGKRSADGEERRSNPFGYSTWWLTSESKVRDVTRGLVAEHAAGYMMHPAFILNCISMSPTKAELNKTFAKIFPTLLGIKLSNRLKDEVFADAMKRVSKVAEVDEARAQAMLVEMSNELKGGGDIRRLWSR